MIENSARTLSQGHSVWPWRAFLAGLIVTFAPMISSTANAACINAVFFDLGDTLVESGPGGLFVVKPGAQQTIDELQALGKQVGVITNVPGGWTRANLEAVMADPSFLDEFSVLVLSSQAPASKPNALIYTHAHGLLPAPVPIGQVAFVGETLSEIANVQVNPTSGARAAGMIGIHLSSGAPSPLADYTVAPNALPTLVDVVENHCDLFQNGFETDTAIQWL